MGVKGLDKDGIHTTSQEIAKWINIENAKKVAFTLMIGFSLYHGILMVRNGGNSCKWLLSQGRFQGYNTWQPYGCMVHQYSTQDARVCLNYISYWGGKNRLLFVGDERLRQLFVAFVAVFNSNEGRKFQAISLTSRPANLTFRDAAFNLQVDFIWMPVVNGSLYEYMRWCTGEKDLPSFIVINSGGVPVRNENMTKNIVDNYRVNLTYVTNPLTKLKKRSRIIWMMQDPVDEVLLFRNKTLDRHPGWTNRIIDYYNAVLGEILAGTSLEVWSSNRLIANSIGFDETSDGLQVPPLALRWDSQILFNMYCNNHMKFYDGTCCSKPEKITLTQIFTFSFFGFCLISSFCCLVIEYLCTKTAPNGSKVDRRKPFLPTHNRIGSDLNLVEVSWFETTKDLSYALTRFGLILCYFFVCDRTIFFMKENKSFTFLSFLLPITYITVLGLFFTEPSQKTGMLHRDITDEWKGWMQLVILIYHITGASKVLPIYMLIRCLVSAYLFISGYGHFTYFWSKGDRGLTRICKGPSRTTTILWQSRKLSLRRFLEVLFRLNLLVVSLCLVMNRPYQFYYFIPLVTFWFIILYLTMIMWPQVSMESAESHKIHYLWFLIKLVVVVVLVTLLYASEFVFDKIFLTNPMKALFVTSDDSVHEWRFRWQLDRYSTLSGMLFGFLYQIAKQNRLIKDNHQLDLYSRPITLLLSFLGLIVIIPYAVFTFLCPSKDGCNSVHSYLVILPIVGYILARNTCGAVRQKFSTLFAWFGRISLEMFIAQYHIWLAADTHGVLVLIPSNQVLNIIVTSFIFVCVSHEIHHLTRFLLPFAVPDDWRPALRNILIFFLLLLPIAISHGIFAF